MKPERFERRSPSVVLGDNPLSWSYDMGNKPDAISWDPQTRVSFPRPDRRATAEVKFERDGVQFAVAPQWRDDLELGKPTAAAYFVQEQIPWGSWHRISKADYEMIHARCKADPTSKLCVASCNKHHLTFVFWPAEVDTTGLSTWQVFDPGVDEKRVTFIKAQILEHREPPDEEDTEPVGWESLPPVEVVP